MFGVGCLRFARDRTNTDVLLGNHEAAMLWALRDSTRIGFWMSIGGQRHDLDELRSDEPLQRWLRGLPSLIRLPDRSLLQHCCTEGYLSLISLPESDPVKAINERVRDLLETGGEDQLWDVLSGPNVFATQPERLFFFSSRRRHTRFDCDWSSDVCSSDLPLQDFTVGGTPDARQFAVGGPARRVIQMHWLAAAMVGVIEAEAQLFAPDGNFRDIDRKSVV